MALAGPVALGCVIERHQTSSSVLPMTSRASTARWASAAQFLGEVKLALAPGRADDACAGAMSQLDQVVRVVVR